MLSKLAVRRLTKLADFMNALPRSANKHFDMNHWFDHDGDHVVRIPQSGATQEHLMDCGTTACAAGWAATIPEFNRKGLKLINGEIRFGRLNASNDYAALKNFFNIDRNDASYLFRPNRGWFEGRAVAIETPKQWAKMCRKFIKENSK